MNLPPRAQELVDAYLDRTATSDEITELELLVVTNPEIAQHLVHTSQLESLLNERLNQSRRQPDVDALVARLNSPAPPIVTPIAVRMIRSLRTTRYATAAAILVVAAIFYGTFTVLAWNLNRGRHTDDELTLTKAVLAASADDYVATLSTATDCRWSTAPLVVGTRLAAGKLQLEEGHVEIEFNEGATVSFDGPCQFDLASAGGGHVQNGILWAVVPQRATGFTITTPTATVVDLGTEFSVEVNEAGETDVQVTKGNVELHPGRQASLAPSQRPIPLAAGEARRVEINSAGEPTVRKISTQSKRPLFAKKSADPVRLPIIGAFASSEHGVTRQANNLINGSGMHGERHTNGADNTMWHTAFDHVKGEFVLFDLGRIRRLHSMKVWNYNEGKQADGNYTQSLLFEERGVAQADIYLSASGKGDPISRPTEWRLIAEDHKFPLASGTAEYATPEFIPLENMAARFAAIVIDARHHTERTQPNPHGECVGLSEVQFFGEVINGSKPPGGN